MKKRNGTITVCGYTATGKTAIACAIKEMLMERFGVEVVMDNVPEDEEPVNGPNAGDVWVIGEVNMSSRSIEQYNQITAKIDEISAKLSTGMKSEPSPLQWTRMPGITVASAPLQANVKIEHPDQPTPKPFPKVLRNDDGIRPGGPPDGCFYCHRKVGDEHARDCVAISKWVRVRYSYELDVEVPHHWDAGNIEFHRNESSWCAGNSLKELAVAFPDDGQCPCNAFECEVLDDRMDADPIQAPARVPAGMN